MKRKGLESDLKGTREEYLKYSKFVVLKAFPVLITIKNFSASKKDNKKVYRDDHQV